MNIVNIFHVCFRVAGHSKDEEANGSPVLKKARLADATILQSPIEEISAQSNQLKILYTPNKTKSACK